MSPTVVLKFCLVFLNKRNIVDGYEMPCRENVSMLCSGMSYSTVGCGFNVNESTKYSKSCAFKRSIHKTRLHINQLTEML